MSTRMRRVSAVFWVVVLVFWVLTVPAVAATSYHTASVWDWDRTWSGTRLVLAAGLVGGAGLLCSQMVFPTILAPHRDAAPWPREAFGQTLALFFALAGVAFLTLFAWASDELREGNAGGPSGAGRWLSQNWRWLALAALDAGLVAWALTWFRRPQTATRRDPSTKGA